MELLKDRRVVIAGGAALALIAGLVVAVVIAMRQDDSDGPPPASEGGLMVQTGHDGALTLDPRKPLRCFVNGQLVGEMPVIDCARKNGVATGALSVGVDASGALTAARTPDLAPPPPPPPPTADQATDQAAAETDQVASTADQDAAPSAGGQPCWDYDGGAWTRSPQDMSLNACVQSLFAGQCIAPGAAVYGRWGDRTLRLVLGKVEIESADGPFHTLARQQGGCAIPALG